MSVVPKITRYFFKKAWIHQHEVKAMTAVIIWNNIDKNLLSDSPFRSIHAIVWANKQYTFEKGSKIVMTRFLE